MRLLTTRRKWVMIPESEMKMMINVFNLYEYGKWEIHFLCTAINVLVLGLQQISHHVPYRSKITVTT